jgi:hypothetical protein
LLYAIIQAGSSGLRDGPRFWPLPGQPGVIVALSCWARARRLISSAMGRRLPMAPGLIAVGVAGSVLLLVTLADVFATIFNYDGFAAQTW